MRVKVRLKQSVVMPDGNSIKDVTGDLDANGILWLERHQDVGKRDLKREGLFIHLGSLCVGSRMDEPVAEVKPKGKKGEATA